MKLNTLLFLGFLTIASTSCNGRTDTQAANSKILTENIANADTVTDLGNNIMVVYQDRKSTYWFGSWENGLYCYDGKIILHFTTNNGLPNNRIEEIKEDINGNVYFSTSNGIAQFDGKRFNVLKESNTVNEWKLEQNDLWFKDGWNSGYVYRYDGNLLHKLKLPKIKAGEDHISKNPGNPNPYTVYSIYNDSKGNVWFGTGALGALRFNGKNFDWIIEKDVAEIYNDASEPSNGVRSIIEDKDGRFWFNTLYRYNVYGSDTASKANNENRVFYSKEKSIGNLEGKTAGSFNEYLSVAKDNNDELWIATYRDGIWRFNGVSIIHYHVKDGTKDITVFCIYKDNKGDLWLGTHENGAFKFNGETFERFQLSI